jgi:hypothetical protein
MGDTYRIAHISDLHLTPGMGPNTTHSHSVKRLSVLSQYFHDNEFDKVIITGDLTNRGDEDSLLVAYSYIFDEVLVQAPTVKIGLKLPLEKVIVVPGNHDAYDCRDSNGPQLLLWQKSLENFNKQFLSFKFSTENFGCRYYWIPKGDGALFIVAVDSCFLGDPTLRHVPSIRSAAISQISKPARGKLSTRQSEQLLKWYDLGVHGKLPNNFEETQTPNGAVPQLIPKDQFARSFKIIAMHHYLFRPSKPVVDDDVFLKTNCRDIVFKNIALADFDMLLCGHKHQPDLGDTKYGKHFDDRARVRYLLNLFRRLTGSYSLPFQLSDDKRSPLTKAFSELSHTLTSRLRPQYGAKYIDSLVEALRKALVKPDSLEKYVEEAVRDHGYNGCLEIPREELQDMRKRLDNEFSAVERKALSNHFTSVMSRHLKFLESRPFLHCMSASTTKEGSPLSYSRGFNTYEISMDKWRFSVKARQMKWNEDLSIFEEAGWQNFNLRDSVD